MTGPNGIPAKGLVARTKEQGAGQGMSRFKQPMKEDSVKGLIKKLRSAHTHSVVSQIRSNTHNLDILEFHKNRDYDGFVLT